MRKLEKIHSKKEIQKRINIGLKNANENKVKSWSAVKQALIEKIKSFKK